MTSSIQTTPFCSGHRARLHSVVPSSVATTLSPAGTMVLWFMSFVHHGKVVGTTPWPLWLNWARTSSRLNLIAEKGMAFPEKLVCFGLQAAVERILSTNSRCVLKYNLFCFKYLCFPLFFSTRIRTRPTSPLHDLRREYSLPRSKLSRSSKDVCVLSRPWLFPAKLWHDLYVSRSKDFLVGVFLFSTIPDIVWPISEHKIHRRCKCLTVLKLLLLGEHK